MSFDTEKLYSLLPSVYRIRDAEQGNPLKALLSVFAEQIALIEENLEQLYDDQFIETCADWVVPYIGDLIGCRQLHGVAPKIISPRAEVANTIAYRRRKGTASMLEQLAKDVTGWPAARVVEFFQLLAWTQHMNHVRQNKGGTMSLRNAGALEFLNTPFEDAAHTVEVRRIASGRGRYGIGNVGVFLWRIKAYPLTASPAVKVDDLRYRFSPLNNDMQLYTKPEPEDEVTHLAEPINVPMPISRRMLRGDKPEDVQLYYGPGRSILLNVDGVDIVSKEICVCNLSDAEAAAWAHEAPDGKYAIDPELGRIALPSAKSKVLVTFHYGFSMDIGGGEYERASGLDSNLQPVIPVAAPNRIRNAIGSPTNGGVIEIKDSGRYEEILKVNVNPGKRMELRAANGCRPTLILKEEMLLTGGSDSEITIDGLLIAGGALRVPAADGNQLKKLTLRNCTLVPGLSLTEKGEPRHAGNPSLIVHMSGIITVVIENCILGGLRVAGGAVVTISNSIVDSCEETGVAYAAADGESAGGMLSIVNSTIIGKLHAGEMSLASNSIFHSALADGDNWAAPVLVTRKQKGCVRFCWLPSESRVPRQYRCQPDLAIQKALDEALHENPGLPGEKKVSIADAIRRKMRPAFADLRYGRPAYCQLGEACPVEIRTGADDEAEMGAFHDLYQPQRETNLLVRLEEYLRFGLEAGIFHAS